MKFFVFTSLSVFALLLGACTPPPTASVDSQYLSGVAIDPSAVATNEGFWDGDSASGSPKIRINRAEQKAYFYKGNTLVGVTPVSTGDSEHVTPPGTFKVTQRSPDHRSSLYGNYVSTTTGQVVVPDVDSRKDKRPPGTRYEGAPMTHFLRFNGGIGMHEGFLPGYPASHGCIRLPKRMAKLFYDNAPLGTPVIVE